MPCANKTLLTATAPSTFSAKPTAANPKDPQTLSYLADLYKTRKDDATAAQLYQQLLNIDPTQSSAPMNLGAYHMEQGHNEQAIALFNQALRISPALVLVRLNLAIALIRTRPSRRSPRRSRKSPSN